MEEKTNLDVFLEYVPAFNVWQKAILIYLFQLIVFILVIAFYLWLSLTVFYGALLAQFIVSTMLVFFYIYLANNAKIIRDKYKKKYGKLAGQYFWYYYQSYTTPIIFVAFFFPLLLINYGDLLPRIINLPSHFITNSLFPFYIAIPLGIIVIAVGLLMKRHSGGYNMIVDNYLYMIYPEKSRLITEGMYKYIRNPQYLCRGIIAVGFGVLANNLTAIGIGFIHFVSYCAIIPAEDKELFKRFGGDFWEYKKKVPALFPRYGNWRKFVRFIFYKK